MFPRIVAIAAIGALAFWLMRPPPRDLLKYATKHIDVPGAYSYSWLSDTDLLVQTNTSQSSTPSGIWSGYFEMVDFQTGKRTRLDGLTTAIMRHANHYDARYGSRGFERSPTGEWLLWHCIPPANRVDRIVTARTDGSGYHEWSGQYSPYWTSGHQWASPSSPPHRIYDAASPDTKPVLSDTDPEARRGQIRIDAPLRKEALPYLEAQLHSNGSRMVLNIIRIVPGTPSNQLPALWDTLPFPGGTGMWSSKPDPQQSRLILMFYDAGISTPEAVLQLLIPGYKAKIHPNARFYIYDADHRTLREIGSIKMASLTHSDVAKPEWLPDGKHIQFYYHNAVYVVSTE